MVFIMELENRKAVPKYTLDEALDAIGFGKYNAWMLLSCCLIILALYLDIFGFSVALPEAACDMRLTTTQQGILTAMPLVGIMVSSYVWGLSADTMGRRKTLLIAMPVGVLLNIVASFAPTYASLTALKFLSAAFTASANAAGFVLMGESVPTRYRAQVIFLMVSATFFVQFIIGVFALPILNLSFAVSWHSLVYRPWRLLLFVISLPGAFGVLGLLFLYESPKYLLSKGREDEAMDVLRSIYSCNTGENKNSFPVKAVCLETSVSVLPDAECWVQKIWNQTAPLFKPPLHKNSLKLYYILICAFMTTTGYTMWIPTLTNAYFSGDDRSGMTFCEVASKAAASKANITYEDCNNVIKPITLYAVMIQSCVAGILTLILSFLVQYVGKRQMTILVFVVSSGCGLVLLFIRIPMLSIVMFYVFLYVSFILGNVNTYLMELTPIHLRGMATCLSVIVARGFGFFSVQLIAALLEDHCPSMVAGYVALVLSGLLVSILLPSDISKNATISEGNRQVETSLTTDCEKTRL